MRPKPQKLELDWPSLLRRYPNRRFVHKALIGRTIGSSSHTHILPQSSILHFSSEVSILSSKDYDDYKKFIGGSWQYGPHTCSQIEKLCLQRDLRGGVFGGFRRYGF